MKRYPGALARRYARALMEAATAAGGRQPQQLGSELGELGELLEEHPALAEALSNPALPAEARGRVLQAVVERAGGSPLLVRFVALLAARERTALLGAIRAAYREQLDAAQGVVSARAVSAVTLSQAQRDGLAGALAEALGKSKIELVSEVDPSVLGGVLLRVGGQSYDGTVRTRLAALRRRLGAGR